MRSHSVTCHPAEVTFPPLPQPKLVLDLVTPEGCKAELIWVVVISQSEPCIGCYRLHPPLSFYRYMLQPRELITQTASQFRNMFVAKTIRVPSSALEYPGKSPASCSFNKCQLISTNMV